jgi:hypothetical protein
MPGLRAASRFHRRGAGRFVDLDLASEDVGVEELNGRLRLGLQLAP